MRAVLSRRRWSFLCARAVGRELADALELLRYLALRPALIHQPRERQAGIEQVLPGVFIVLVLIDIAVQHPLGQLSDLRRCFFTRSKSHDICQ